jgi:hypothetical protein
MFAKKQTWKKLDTAFSRVSISEKKGSPAKTTFLKAKEKETVSYGDNS